MPELLLPRLKREIAARLAELRPLVAEAERLEAAKEALLAEAAAEQRVRERKESVRERARSIARNSTRTIRTNGTAGAAANGSAVLEAAETNGARASKPAPAPAAAPAAEEENGRASRGTNQSAILAIVEERPGVSVAEIASVTKIAKPTVATTVSKLKREGVLAAEAGGVKLASRQPVTLSQVADAAPVREDGVSDEEWEAARREGAAA